MLTTFWACIKLIFSGAAGSLLKILLANSAKAIVTELLDKEAHKIAYEFVKQLNARDDISNKEKQELFNKQMLEWSKMLGKTMASSTINCLRELAVAAIKSEQ